MEQNDIASRRFEIICDEPLNQIKLLRRTSGPATLRNQNSYISTSNFENQNIGERSQWPMGDKIIAIGSSMRDKNGAIIPGASDVLDRDEERGSGDKTCHNGYQANDLTFHDSVDDVTLRLHGFLFKLEKKWEKEYNEEYPNAYGSSADRQRLMEILPQLETQNIKKVKQTWSTLAKLLEEGYHKNSNLCISKISHLMQYVHNLEREHPSCVERCNDTRCGAPSMVFPESVGISGDFAMAKPCIDHPTTGEYTAVDVGSSTKTGTESIECWNMICGTCQAAGSSRYCKVSKYNEQLMLLNRLRQGNAFATRVAYGRLIMVHCSKLKDFRLSPMGGVFGPAVLAIDASTHQPVVVKSIVTNYTKLGKDAIDLHRNLINPLLRVHSEYIVPYSHCLNVEDNIVIASPLCERNLGEYLMQLNSTSRFSEDLAHMMVNQIVRGLNFLHSQNLVHGNLKPSNILADSNGNLRLSEFGLNGLRCYAEQTVGLRIWWAQETLRQFDSADEARTGSEGIVLYVTKESDVQSCGMILHYLATGGVHPFGRYPFEIMINLNENKPLVSTKSRYLSDLVIWMLDREPKLRPTSWQILNHVYIWDKEKQWKFLLTCAGVGTSSRLPIKEFHSALDQYASDHNMATNWVNVIRRRRASAELQCQESMIVDPADYSDSLSGLLALLRDTLPSSSEWFVAGFPTIVLTLYRIVENTPWMDHPDFSTFRTTE